MEGKRLRKACDLCYRKRIKCDGDIPRCSACRTHNVQCTHEAESRKRPKRRPATSQALALARSSGPEAEASLKSQIDDLNARLQQAMDENSRLNSIGVEAPSMSSPSRFSLGLSQAAINMVNASFSPSPSSSVFLLQDSFELPAEAVVRSLIDTYLATFNGLLPLFDAKRLLHEMEQWYRVPSQRTSKTWASIIVAMALAQSHSNGQFGDATALAGFGISECITKIQSVLNDMIMGDMEMVNIQVILGLCFLFLNGPDLRPSAVFLAAALRLAHSMGFHRSEGYENCTAAEAIQRRRVWWIAYVLDQEVCSRTHQPPILRDEDIDVDIPSDIDGPGFVHTIDDSYEERFYFFRSRVQLARIQTRCYDCLFSVNAKKRDPAETAAMTRDIRTALKDWRASIPPCFSPTNLAQRGEISVVPRFCVMLYSANLKCLAHLSRVSAMEWHWIDQLLNYARRVGAGLPGIPPPAPLGWNGLIEEFRQFMPLFSSIPRKDPPFIRDYACSYVSGLLCLAANEILNIDSLYIEYDESLKYDAVRFIESCVDQPEFEMMRKVQMAFSEFNLCLPKVRVSQTMLMYS